jgi:hypothetical protein
MDLLKTSAMLKALILELQKYGKIEDLQSRRALHLFLSLDPPYYQEGCNISSKKKDQKCSSVDLSEN